MFKATSSRRAGVSLTSASATLLTATLVVWLWFRPNLFDSMPALRDALQELQSGANAVVSAGRSGVVASVQSAQAFVQQRTADLDRAVQSAVEGNMAVLVDTVAARVEAAAVDRHMPLFVQALVRDTIRGVIPEVKQGVFSTTRRIILTPVKHLQLRRLGLFPPAHAGPAHGRTGTLAVTPAALALGINSSSAPTLATWWAALRARILYVMWPADKSVWRSARSKRWWAAQALGMTPLLGQLWWLLLFVAKDKTDEFQLAEFIVGFEASKFVGVGLWSVVYGATRQHLCMHVLPRGFSVAGSIWGALVWLAQQAQGLKLGALPAATGWAWWEGVGPHTPLLTVEGGAQLNATWWTPPPSTPPSHHSCMEWGPTLNWLDGTFFLMQLVLVAAAYGMLPWSRRRHVHSPAARGEEEGGGASPAATSTTPGRPGGVTFSTPSAPSTPPSHWGRGTIWADVDDEEEEEGRGADRLPQLTLPPTQQGAGQSPPATPRTAARCGIMGRSCWRLPCPWHVAARWVQGPGMRCLARVGLPRHLAPSRPTRSTLSLQERGGYLAATWRYYVAAAGVTLALGGLAVGHFLWLSPQDAVAVWRLQATLFWVRAVFGLSAAPFVFFKVPLLMQLLVCAGATGYNAAGETVLKAGRREYGGSGAPLPDAQGEEDEEDYLELDGVRSTPPARLPELHSRMQRVGRWLTGGAAQG